MGLNIDSDEAEMKPMEVPVNEADLMELQQTGRCIVRVSVDARPDVPKKYQVEDLYTGAVYRLQRSPATWRIYAHIEEDDSDPSCTIASITRHLRESLERQKNILIGPDISLHPALGEAETIKIESGGIRFRIRAMLDVLDSDMRKRFICGDSKEEAGVLMSCDVHEFLQLRGREMMTDFESRQGSSSGVCNRRFEISPRLHAALRYPRMHTVSIPEFQRNLAAIHERMEACRFARFVILDGSQPRAIYMPADIYQRLCVASGVVNRGSRATA